MKIPKKIHYCWFGGKEKPQEVMDYIATWRKFCPDYEIKEWNESNFDVQSCRYVAEAYAHKKWAFVSDVARIAALYHEGGIYLDTDVEVLCSLDSLLENKGFLGFEGERWIATNIIGAQAGHPVLYQFLQDYLTRRFVMADGSLDMTTNVAELTKLLQSNYGLNLNGQEQNVAGFHIYPTDYFSPYDYIQGRLKKTDNTYTIHWYSQTWTKQSQLRRKLAQWYHRFIGLKMK